MRLLSLIPTHALAPALDGDGIERQCIVFRAFSGENLLCRVAGCRGSWLLGCHPERSRRTFVIPRANLSVMLSAAKYLSIIYVGKLETLNQVQGDVEVMGYDQLGAVRGASDKYLS